MLKVLLLLPPMSIKDNYANLEKVATNMPSLGLSYIYSAFEEIGCKVDFLDYQNKNISIQELIAGLDIDQYDLIGMQAYISNINRCFSLAELLKKRRQEIRIILGGPHATIFADQVIEHLAIDYVCVGEAEFTVQDLVRHIENDTEPENVKGLYYKNKQREICKNPPRPFVKDLDLLPEPRYEIFEQEDYFPAVHVRGNKPSNLITSRGCPYSCTFCAASKVWGGHYRVQSIDRTIKEMYYLKGKLSVDGLQIYDDNFTTNIKRVKELCRRMIEEKLYFEWICYTRADAIGDAEMLSLMKEAGCYLIVVGIESGNERTLELLNKKLDLDVARKNIQLANNVGINVLSSFMLGIPGDTREVIEQTIKFSQDIGLTYATFPIFTPYPGTPIYDVALEVGVLEKDNFDEFSRWGDGVYSYGNMNPDVFRELQRKAFLGFYLRPRIIWKMFLDVLKLPWRRKIRFIRGGILQLLGWLFYKNAQRKV